MPPRPPSDVRVSQHVWLARSGPAPACPLARLPPTLPPASLETEAGGLYLCCVQSRCPTVLEGGGGGGWPGLPCCYLSMHQIVFMTPGEIYLILTLKRSEREKK